MFKRYLLAVAENATTFGALFGCVVGVVVCLATLLVVDRLPRGTDAVVILGFFATIIASVVLHTYLREKYITTTGDFKDLKGPCKVAHGYVWLLKVENGRVVATGEKFWGKRDIHAVLVPWVFDGKFLTTIRLFDQAAHGKVLVEVGLTVHVSPAAKGGFDAQEVFEHVVSQGQQSIERWLAAEFKGAMESSPTVWEVFEAGMGNDPYTFAKQVLTALQQTPFKSCLSTVLSVEATVPVDMRHPAARAHFGR